MIRTYCRVCRSECRGTDRCSTCTAIPKPKPKKSAMPSADKPKPKEK